MSLLNFMNGITPKKVLPKKTHYSIKCTCGASIKAPHTSIYHGVSRNSNLTYRSRIMFNGIQLTLGNFDNEIDAAKAFDKFVIKHKLERELNFDYGELNV